MFYFLLGISHVLGWFVFSAIWSVIFGRTQMLKLPTAVALGVASFLLNLFIIELLRSVP
jgi:hypothetical protein